MASRRREGQVDPRSGNEDNARLGAGLNPSDSGEIMQRVTEFDESNRRRSEFTPNDQHRTMLLTSGVDTRSQSDVGPRGDNFGRKRSVDRRTWLVGALTAFVGAACRAGEPYRSQADEDKEQRAVEELAAKAGLGGSARPDRGIIWATATPRLNSGR
jgi:hypothetical protein